MSTETLIYSLHYATLAVGLYTGGVKFKKAKVSFTFSIG